jgi:hypothetical protein
MVKKSQFRMCYKFLDLAAMGVERGPIFQNLKSMKIQPKLTCNRLKMTPIISINCFLSISSIKMVYNGQKMRKMSMLQVFGLSGYGS